MYICSKLLSCSLNEIKIRFLSETWLDCRAHESNRYYCELSGFNAILASFCAAILSSLYSLWLNQSEVERLNACLYIELQCRLNSYPKNNKYNFRFIYFVSFFLFLLFLVALVFLLFGTLYKKK